MFLEGLGATQFDPLHTAEGEHKRGLWIPRRNVKNEKLA
jgi:hypothetical protein